MDRQFVIRKPTRRRNIEFKLTRAGTSQPTTVTAKDASIRAARFVGVDAEIFRSATTLWMLLGKPETALGKVKIVEREDSVLLTYRTRQLQDGHQLESNRAVYRINQLEVASGGL